MEQQKIIARILDDPDEPVCISNDSYTEEFTIVEQLPELGTEFGEHKDIVTDIVELELYNEQSNNDVFNYKFYKIIADLQPDDDFVFPAVIDGYEYYFLAIRIK